jgi:UDP-N-acetylmuramoyl-tripeptide--D-alanyl-D-alanine ligase
MKLFILKILHSLSRAIIRRHKPFVVAITGTVGKSTTAQFLYDALCALYGADQVGVSLHNYNGEYGVPFTIIQTASPHSNPFLWIAVFAKGLWLATFAKRYPKYLVLEYGIDHPGEMDMLTDICEPDVGVMQAISKNHVENFSSYDEYVAEKLKMIPRSKRVVYNGDDAKIRRYLSEHPREHTLSYGRKSVESVDIRAINVTSTLEGLFFDVQVDGIDIPVKVPVVGSHQSYNILPVFALAHFLNRDVHEITSIFEELVPQKGRGSILQGVNDTTIIDGSYNGSHEAILAGIEYLSELSSDLAKGVFLGDMRELGSESKELHESVADRLIELQPQFVVLVGEEMRKYALPMLEESLGERVLHFANSKIAGQRIREILYEIEAPKVIFVKGSQNTIYLEEGIKEFLFDKRDEDNLCRQSPRWIKKKNEYFTLVAPV